MKTNTFTISDESLNSHGFKVVTSGINTERFKKNPIMFYMHERAVIGRWDNIRTDGNKLLADAVFDTNTPLGTEIKQRVEDGFLRAASIGIADLDVKDINGVKTVVKCDLRECSIVDIPSNPNAIKLYCHSKKIVYNLSDYENEELSKENTIKIWLLNRLGLPFDLSDEDIIKELENAFKSLENDQKQDIEHLMRKNSITKTQYNMLVKLQENNPASFNQILNEFINDEKEDIKKLAIEGWKQAKYMYKDIAVYENIGLKIGMQDFEKLLSITHRMIKPTDILNLSKEDYQDKDLQWYRKNKPDYLKDNPQEYERLVNKELNKQN